MHCVCEVAQSCPTLCDPVDCSSPGSSVHGILQARILEWVAIPSSRGSSWRLLCLLHWQVGTLPLAPPGKPTTFLTVTVTVKSLSRVRLFATPWTVAYQAPLCMGFSRQEYWSGLPFPSPRDLPATNSYQSQNKCLKKGKKCYSNIQNEKKIL